MLESAVEINNLHADTGTMGTKQLEVDGRICLENNESIA